MDFANDNIGTLFRKMFMPTLLGMLSMVVLNLADGAFVGHGAGTEALAAINIAAPIFDIMIGIGIMFGIGASVISSIHLSKGDVKAARINSTQSLIGSFIVTAILGAIILLNLDDTCRLFGSSEALVPLAGSYLRWVALSLPFCIIGNVGAFVVRLDGSPKFSMMCTLLACVLNIFLDWLFVFPMQMGLEGAAIATSISFTISALVVLYYMLFMTSTLRLYRLPFTLDAFRLTLCNLWRQVKAGFSAMIGEISISFSVIVGNYVFIRYLGEDGVAAYGVACYCMPVIFMLANAIVQSVQPIMSFAYGTNDKSRLALAKRIAIRSGILAGIFSTLLLSGGAHWVTLIFIPEGERAFTLSVEGMRYFGLSGILITMNLVLVGYLQSIKRSMAATVFSLLRGIILVLPCFIFLPIIIGVPGIWLAIPMAELLTLIIIVIISR